MTSSSSEYEEFSDSWASSESTFNSPRRKKQPKKVKSASVEVLASGVAFLLPAQLSMTRGLVYKRSKVVLPNVDPMALTRLIQHEMHTEVSLDIQVNECVSFLRLAMVFNMEDLFQRTRNLVLTTISGQEKQLASFKRVINCQLNSRLMVDDALFVTLDHVLLNLQHVQRSDNGSSLKSGVLQEMQRPALTPLSQPHGRLLTFSPADCQAKKAPEEPEKTKRSRFNPFDLVISPKKMLKKLGAGTTSPNDKKPGTVAKLENSKKITKAKVTPMLNSNKPKSENTKGIVTTNVPNGNGQDGSTPTRKNPLALSVIRKIPRTKPY